MSQIFKKSCIFDDQDLIGQGAYSKVYRSTKFSSDSNETTAVKVYDKSKINRDVIDHAKRQKNILKNIQSEYICQYRQSLESKSKIYMVQKLQKGITLDKLIFNNKKMDVKQIIKIAKAILNGIEYLYNKRIMHRDLKPSNIIYDSESGKAVLLDLGFAIYFHKNDQKVLTQIVGTPDYMSPQIMMGKKYNSLSDIWSFGVILYELLEGQLPFKGRSQKQILNSILSRSLHFKSNKSPILEWIIINCLKVDPNERIRWQDLFEWKNTGQIDVKKRKSLTKVPQKFRNSKVYSYSIDIEHQKQQTNCKCFFF